MVNLSMRHSGRAEESMFKSWREIDDPWHCFYDPPFSVAETGCPAGHAQPLKDEYIGPLNTKELSKWKRLNNREDASYKKSFLCFWYFDTFLSCISHHVHFAAGMRAGVAPCWRSQHCSQLRKQQLFVKTSKREKQITGSGTTYLKLVFLKNNTIALIETQYRLNIAVDTRHTMCYYVKWVLKSHRPVPIIFIFFICP